MKKIKIRSYISVFSLLFSLLLSGCSSADTASSAASSADVSTSAETNTADADPSRAVSTELFAMDTVMELTAYGPHAEEALSLGETEISRLDELLSVSSENGDVFRINRGDDFPLSSDTRYLLACSYDFSESTGGLFDCTIEPVMSAWGFRDQNYRVPSAEELQALLSNVDYTKAKPDGDHLDLPDGFQIDLGGIAKGYTSSQVISLFRSAGVTSGIISLGGNVQTLGTKPDGTPWRIGIQNPEDLNDTIAIVEVSDEAVITSGAYQRFFEEDGQTYHHIIDPRTGYPADSGLISVTIVSPDGTLADALSTSLFIMGAEQAAGYWKAHEDSFDAVLMDENGTIYVTAGLADRCTITGGTDVRIIQ